ncbi:MAG: hypothetical protein QOC65_1020, partial [Sphingomonadales bacterium]|nr:hypothetical protein [Sphingomonadales bacterium]
MLKLSALRIAAAAALAAFAWPAAAQEAPADPAPPANEWFPADQQQAAADAASVVPVTTDANAPATTAAAP